MRPTIVKSLLVIASVLALASLAPADEGMWLFNAPPLDLLKSKYNFEPSPQWLERLQKSCVRFSTGGSGSIVSADGLVMTNHHVGSDELEKLSTSDRNLLDTGFLAKSRDKEAKCEGLELMSLWSIEDVTDRVTSAATPGMAPADAAAARRKIMNDIEQEAQKKSGLDCQVVTLYHGGLYHLYSYKRYTDIRLVMAPEQDAAFFGGDTDNFEYPRYCLDVCFFRIYENGEPLKAEHYLEWNKEGSSEGDLAIVAGHPATTQRLHTVAHLEFLRDVEYPANLRNLWRREVQAQYFAGRGPENERMILGELHGAENSRKAITGIMAGLLDPEIMQQKVESERILRAIAQKRPENRAAWNGWDQVAKAQQTHQEFFDRYSALEGRRRAIRSELFSIARNIVRLADELPKPSGERLREFRDSELDSLYLDLYAPTPIYDELETYRLACGLTALAQEFGADDSLVVEALGGQSPADRARTLVSGSKLKDIEVRKALVAGGADALRKANDPMIRLAAALEPETRALRKRYEDEVESAEHDGYAKIAAAKFAIQGQSVYPDATFTLRLSFGPIKGYTDGEQTIPPYTTLGGAFERMAQRESIPPFKLPNRWASRMGDLNPQTPFNFVCTADIIGGNSGSPVVNTSGRVIGLVFDGNIPGLVWDIAYTDEKARCVAVDSRAIIECLRKLYDAGALADEITSGGGQAPNPVKTN